MQNKDNIIEKIIDRKPPVPVINDKDVFLQTVEISLTSDINEYRVRLNSNYKYCNGVIIINTSIAFTNEIFGIKEKGNYILDAVPVKYYLPSEYSGIKNKFIDFFTIAAGTYKKIFFDKQGSTMTDLKMIFLLSNNPTENYKKRHLGFDKIILGSGTNIGKVTFNSNFRFIKNVYFIKSGIFIVNPYISLRDDSKYFLYKLEYDAFDNRLADINERMIPVFMTSNNIDYEIEVSGGGSGFLYIIYEYED